MNPGSVTASRSGWGDWRYEMVPDHWDEARKPGGMPRAHWRRLATAIGRMGRHQFDRRWQHGQQLIQANGVTYNVYGDPQGKERPWPMDPIPFLISEEEWAGIEKAIIQRATLLNMLLGDIYGAQHLLRERRLPPEFVHANPNFLRPCFGVPVPGDIRLHLYAADLARSPDGRWWVVTDRTQAPSGAGYALENRMVSARTLPSVFSQCSVRQLQRFFQNGRDGLTALSPGRRRIVLLTPGPYNETYFEHSYLAKFWGFPLVEGADLTVRDDRVFLKTLAGLEPVDMILRRQDDGYCDPLELRGDSLLGVPGLLRAVRAGNVAVANALGSGVVESPGLMAFYEGLCYDLLGERLAMPSLATWWCGQEEPRRYVLANLPHLVIKPAFPRYGLHPVFAGSLDEAELADLRRRIEEQPENYVAQEQVKLSTTPVWTEDGLAARHLIIRVFANWDGQNYSVMPGALARVASSSSSLIVTMQLGGGSKDTWVLGSGEEPPAPAPRKLREEVDPSMPVGDLPSRVADNLFWLGRYAERVEAIVRLVRVLLPALSGEADFGNAVSLETALHMLVGLDLLPRGVLENSIPEQRRQLERALTAVVYDPSQMTGLGANLKNVRRVAWQLKERLSADTWRVIQRLEFDLSRPAHPNQDQRLIAELNLLDRAILSLSAFAGLLMESTTRGYGWRFLDIGRRMERALQMIELLRHGLAQVNGDSDACLEMLLQIADSSITYRTRYLTALRADLVLDLLMTDESNPRALAFQVATLAGHVDNLPERGVQRGLPVERRLALEALTKIRLADIDELASHDAHGRRPELERRLDEIRRTLYDLSDALTGKYLSHLMPSRLLKSF